MDEGRFEKYDSQTEGSRINGWYGILDQAVVKERVFASTPKITSIGIGADAGFVMDPWYVQSYEPYVLAAWANNQNPEFTLSLVDANSHATRSIVEGRFVYLDKIALKKDIRLQNAWMRLQKEFGVKANTVNTNDGSLELIEPYESTTDLQYMVSQGMERIQVPDWFRRKLDTGEISILNQDLRDVTGIHDQSLLFCLNVLLHYPHNDQAEMLHKMSQMLGKGKLLIINEGKPNKDSASVTGFRNILFEENGGWLSEDILLNDYQLRVANKTDNGRIYTLEKI